MFTLLSGLYKYVTQKDEYFILILGLDNSGKSTYLEQVKAKFYPNYKMMNPAKITTTVGCNIGKVDIGRVRLNFWDLGGQEELQSLWDKYYAECHAIIYMIDSTDRQRQIQKIHRRKDLFVHFEAEQKGLRELETRVFLAKFSHFVAFILQ